MRVRFTAEVNVDSSGFSEDDSNRVELAQAIVHNTLEFSSVGNVSFSSFEEIPDPEGAGNEEQARRGPKTSSSIPPEEDPANDVDDGPQNDEEGRVDPPQAGGPEDPEPHGDAGLIHDNEEE